MSIADLASSWLAGGSWQASADDWTRRRGRRLPELLRLIRAFEGGELPLRVFASQLDSFSKEANLWGFRGHAGQMFLNVLLRSADRARLEQELRGAIGFPSMRSMLRLD